MLNNGPILITGGAGMLARGLAASYISRGREPILLDRNACDITQPNDVQNALQRYRPSVVLNCAAHTKVDLCENEPEKANAINGVAVRHLAAAAREFGAMLVHFSTDAVFDGRSSRPYRTDDPVGPLSVYAQSKWLGEQELQKTPPLDWMIIRTAWLFGDGPCFPRTVAARARAGQPLKVVNDQIGSPTFAGDLAEATIELLAKQARGIWHVTNTGAASWFNVATAVLKELKLDVELASVTTSEYLRLKPKQAPRPAYTALDISAAERMLGRPMRSWREALRASHEWQDTIAGGIV